MAEAGHGLGPPLFSCAACGRRRPQAAICAPCGRCLFAAEPLLGSPPAGLDRVWSSAPWEGVAGDLVGALRVRQNPPVASLMAERIERLAPRHMLSGAIVPVPPWPPQPRGRRPGPAAELAAGLAERIDAPVERCLERSLGAPAGEGGTSRIACPPLVRATAAAPRNALLVDLVLDAGAALTACARALRAGGASRVVAVTFARC